MKGGHIIVRRAEDGEELTTLDGNLRKLNSNCNFSIEKAERELDYHPMSARESFHDMVDWIAEHENIPLKK